MKFFFRMCGLAACFYATAIFAQERPVEFLQPNGQEQSFRGYLSGYSILDSVPPGAIAVSHPMRGEYAGGVGTYSDPITLAVGFVLQGTETIPDFPAGKRFYLPRLRKYAIVEDTCGGEESPQDGSCNIGKNGLPWLVIFVDGAGLEDNTAACTRKISNIQTFVMDPGPNYSVVVGELTQSSCATFPDL